MYYQVPVHRSSMILWYGLGVSEDYSTSVIRHSWKSVTHGKMIYFSEIPVSDEQFRPFIRHSRKFHE